MPRDLARSLHDEHRLGHLRLRNRAVLAPMTRISAEPDGTVSRRIAEYYRMFAAGGFGAVITEGSYIDSAHSQTYLDQPGLSREEHVAAWRAVTDAVHGEGAAAIAQLQHSGPQMQGNPHAATPKSPSAVPARGEQLPIYRGSGPYPVPEELTLEEIARIRRDFVEAAVRARAAGFDGIELHGANGYLLDAFHTDHLNLRDDEYGGSAEARVRLSAEIVRDIREELGNELVLGIRISQAKVSDSAHKWSGGVEEARTIVEALADAGVDYLHTTEHRAHAPAFPDQDPRSLAQLARDFAPGISVIANGHIDDGETAKHLLATGQADLVGIGRAALTNPDWPLRVRDGLPLLPPFTADRFDGLAVVRDWELDPERLAATTGSGDIAPPADTDGPADGDRLADASHARHELSA